MRRPALQIEILEDRTLLAGDLLLTTEVPGQIVYNLLQYAQKGSLVSSVSIPSPPGSTEYEDARGLSVDPSGNVNIFDGTFTPSLATYSPTPQTWSFQTTSGWTTVNNVSYGEVAAYNQYVFASDMATANQPTNGIVRFGGGATTIFGKGTDFIQVALGQDGLLYGLAGNGAVQEFNPDTLAKERSFKLTGGPDRDIRSIAIDPSGTIYAATWGGYAVKYDANGKFVSSLSLNSDNLLSIALDTDGQIAIGGRFGNVYLTDESLTSVKTIQTNQWNVFVTFDHYIGTNVDQWTGANSAVDTNWSDGANWSLGTPPSAGQTALFTRNGSVKSFTATVDASSAVANLDIDTSWKGTINVNSALSVAGNFALASGTFGGSGAVTIAGTASRWTGGQLNLGSGGFTDNGSLTINPAAGTLALDGPGSLTNNNTILQTGTGTLSLNNNATLNNASQGTYNIQGNGSIAQSGGGTLANAGVLEKSTGTGTSTMAASTLDNTGTVQVTAGTLDISATVTQIASNTLTGGSWTVKGSAGQSTLDITSASFTTLGKGAKVQLSGLFSAFTNLSGLAAIDAGGSLTLAAGQSFTTAGALTNHGHLTLSAGSILTVSGDFTQGATGKLTLQMGVVGGSTEVGSLVSTTGTVSLAGSLQVTATAVPAVPSSFDILDNEGNAAISGNFAGLSEGATFTVTTGGTTMAFQISYVGSDADGSQNVVITRTS
jgi:hypothetical protein